MRTTINLGQDEVEAIVREHLMTKFKSVGTIDFEIGVYATGHPMYEITVPKFKQLTCEVEIK